MARQSAPAAVLMIADIDVPLPTSFTDPGILEARGCPTVDRRAWSGKPNGSSREKVRR
jgi:hypothetical protein